jgi:hypothetical protein
MNSALHDITGNTRRLKSLHGWKNRTLIVRAAPSFSLDATRNLTITTIRALFYPCLYVVRNTDLYSYVMM